MLVVPLAPAATGNGLAMRAGMLLEVLAGAGPVDVVIVPISGPATMGEWAAARSRRVVVVEPEPLRTRDDVVVRLADPAGRAELAALEGLPAPARLAPPSSARVAVDQLERPAGTVVVLRSHLAPFGMTLAAALDARRVVVDADDDDERLLRSQGESREADAYRLLASSWLARADLVVAASPLDAAAMRARLGFDVETLPNAVRPVPGPTSAPPGRDRLLYVGNLTYRPNVDAVRALADRVLPAVRRERPRATVDVVGRYDDRLADLAERDAVHLTGAVDDLTPWYSGADVVVVPLPDGAGTRIKVLEAFAHRRPVVATPAAVAGLDVVDGRSVHLGANAPELAARAVHLLRSPDAAQRTVHAAQAVLDEHYRLDVVAPRARRLLIG